MASMDFLTDLLNPRRTQIEPDSLGLVSRSKTVFNHSFRVGGILVITHNDREVVVSETMDNGLADIVVPFSMLVCILRDCRCI